MAVRTSPVTSPQRERPGGNKEEDDGDTNFSYSPLSSAMGSPSRRNLYVGSPSTASQKSHGTHSEDMDPPPPYSSPTRSMVSQASSSKYTEIMQFLDKDMETTLSRRVRQGGETNDEDNVTAVSSMSELSPNSTVRHRRRGEMDSKSLGSKSLGGRSYIWDDSYGGGGGSGGRGSSNVFMDNEDAPDQDTATYFSHQQSRGDSTTNGGASDMSEIVEKVKSKVEVIKRDLNETTQRARDHQAELVRVNAARKRRAAKCRTEWENKLRDAREEQADSKKRIGEFVDRLKNDTDDLKAKRDRLQAKKDKLTSSREQSLRLLSEDAARRANQTRKQWQVEEQAVFDKALALKAESIRKNAAESFGPAMDRMVEEGKIKLREKEDAIQGRLEQRRIELQSELDRKLASARDAMRDQLKAEEDRARRASEHKLEDALRNQSTELTAVKDKLLRDRRLLEEGYERSRRMNAESALEGMREVRQSESKEVVELMAANQRELGQISNNNTEQLKQLRLRLHGEEKAHLQRVVERIDAKIGAKKEKARHSARARAAAETERVLSRLREDVMEERRRVKEAIDKEVEDMRLSSHNAIDGLQQQEKRTMERIAALRGEIESYRKQCAYLEDQERDKKADLVEARTRLSALRTDLKQVEDEVNNTELRHNQELSQHQRKSSREYQQLLEEESTMKEALSREEIASANRKEDARSMYAADLTRIRDKVGSLLKRKDDTARDLRKQLAALQDQSEALQDTLDSLRAAQYARVTSSIDADSDDLRENQDLLSRLNIGNIDASTGRRVGSSAVAGDGDGATIVSSGSTRGSTATATATSSSSRRRVVRTRDVNSFRV